MTYVKRSVLRMSDDEVFAFLAANQWARVATVSSDGEPHISTIGYVYHDGRFYFHSLLASRRGRDLTGEPRTALCVDDGIADDQPYTERRGVVVYGRSRLLNPEDQAEDREILEKVRVQFASVFFGDSAARFERSTHGWYELSPYRHTSWDFRRIPQGADWEADKTPS